MLTLRPNISLGLFVDHNSSILKYVKCTQAYALTASPSERERERERELLESTVEKFVWALDLVYVP